MRHTSRRIRDAAGNLARHPVYGPAVRVGSLALVATGLEITLIAAASLPASAYSRPTFLSQPVVDLARKGLPGLLVLAAAAALLFAGARSRSLGPAWHEFEHVARLRWLVGLLAALLAWVFATYDYNFYFDRSHVAERILVTSLVPLIVWRPAFTLVFLLVVLSIGMQFTHPIGGFSWAPPMLPIRVLFLFAALWTLRLVTKRIRTADFLYVLCCLIAAHYWVSGWDKLRLGWVTGDHIGFLLASTYANGWLGFLEPATLGTVVRALLAVNVPMKAITLLVECGALFMLWRRQTVQWFLIAASGFHIAIFAVTGIGFWMWMFVDALVLILFFRRSSPAQPIFTQPRYALSILLIAGGAIWFRPQSLAWLDARATYTYRIEATGHNGRSHALPPSFFSPYDYQFTLGAFRYLVDAPRMAITWGATGDRRLAESLNDARSAPNVLALETSMGRNAFDAGRAAAFDDFVRKFVLTWQRRGGRGRGIAPFQAPATLWTFPRSDPALGGERIERVTVYEVLTWFDGENYVEIRRTPVREIRIN